MWALRQPIETRGHDSPCLRHVQDRRIFMGTSIWKWLRWHKDHEDSLFETCIILSWVSLVAVKQSNSCTQRRFVWFDFHTSSNVDCAKHTYYCSGWQKVAPYPVKQLPTQGSTTVDWVAFCNASNASYAI